MGQLIGALIVLVLYIMLMGFLIGTVAPPFLVLGSVLATGVVPVIYGMTVYKVLDAPGWRRIFWLPVFALLALIALDVAYVALNVLAGMVHTWMSPYLYEALVPVVSLPLNRTGVLWWTHLFGRPATWWLYVLVGTVVKGVIVVGLLLVIRGLKNSVPDTRQPAFRQYFFGQANVELRAVAEQTVMKLYELMTLAAIRIWHISAGPQLWFVWPLTLTAYVGLVAPALAAVLSLAILLAAHAIGIGIAWLATMYISTLLFCMERAVMLARSGYAKCPHAGCHEPVALPIFYCPGCGIPHDRLIPGPCGVFGRACACGDAVLPTTTWLGRSRLRSACSHCKKPMLRELFGGSAHVPIYGPPSCGKTMLMMGATRELVEGRLAGVRADFISEVDRTNYEAIWKPAFESGRVREKTHQMLPDAFLLSVSRGSGLPLSLYVYDPAGEAIERAAEIEGHSFLRYFDGLALLIDPFSLPSFARSYREAGHADLPAATSLADPKEVLERVVNVLETQAGLTRGRDYRRRIAVVITKADLEFVQSEFGIVLDDAPPGEQWASAGLDHDDQLRTWFRENEPALSNVLETRFSALRFFMVSALGHEPAAGAGFIPRRVLDPVAWLLSGRVTLTRPMLARVLGRGAEIAAGLAVFALFVIPGYLGAHFALHAVGVVR